MTRRPSFLPPLTPPASWVSAYIDLRLQLVRARQAAQLRQTDVSARIGLSVRHFARLENAEADPRARILCAWANAVGLRICLTDVSDGVLGTPKRLTNMSGAGGDASA